MASLLKAKTSNLSLDKIMPAVCASSLCISQVRAPSWCLLLLLLVPTTSPRQAELLDHYAYSNMSAETTRSQPNCSQLGMGKQHTEPSCCW